MARKACGARHLLLSYCASIIMRRGKNAALVQLPNSGFTHIKTKYNIQRRENSMAANEVLASQDN